MRTNKRSKSALTSIPFKRVRHTKKWYFNTHLLAHIKLKNIQVFQVNNYTVIILANCPILFISWQVIHIFLKFIKSLLIITIIVINMVCSPLYWQILSFCLRYILSCYPIFKNKKILKRINSIYCWCKL